MVWCEVWCHSYITSVCYGMVWCDVILSYDVMCSGMVLYGMLFGWYIKGDMVLCDILFGMVLHVVPP